MRVSEFREPLQAIAKQFRPRARSPFIPLVWLAIKSGLEIEIRFYSDGKKREAQTELRASSSRIVIYRRSGADGIMDIAPDKEHLLTARERFSVAHELGHFFAFKHFGALPVSKVVDPQEYREQEQCMDDFAQSLLVPDWLGQLWLASVTDQEPISLNSLKMWAASQCAVSGEVVAKALTRLDSNIGFLRAAEAVRSETGKRMFVVFYSSYGAELQLPNMHSFIEDETFVDGINGKSGVGQIEACRLGSQKVERLKVAWQESKMPTSRGRREFKSAIRLSGRGYWLSVRSHRTRNNFNQHHNVQLSFF